MTLENTEFIPSVMSGHLCWNSGN